MKFTDYFKENYSQRLRTPAGNNPVRDRSDSMLMAFELLEAMGDKAVTIVETGTLRSDHGDLSYGDDGASAAIFDKFMAFNKGSFHSVDINPANVEYAKTKTEPLYTTIHCTDSVKFLNGFHESRKIDLLYLDSMDIFKCDPHPSALHHVFELLAAQKNLIPGSIVIIDDADAFFDGGKTGKAMYIREYFTKIGKEPIFDGYQLVYQI